MMRTLIPIVLIMLAFTSCKKEKLNDNSFSITGKEAIFDTLSFSLNNKFAENIEWDFGDSCKSNLPNPIHDYHLAGKKKVTCRYMDGKKEINLSREIHIVLMPTGTYKAKYFYYHSCYDVFGCGYYDKYDSILETFELNIVSDDSTVYVQDKVHNNSYSYSYFGGGVWEPSLKMPFFYFTNRSLNTDSKTTGITVANSFFYQFLKEEPIPGSPDCKGYYYYLIEK